MSLFFVKEKCMRNCGCEIQQFTNAVSELTKRIDKLEALKVTEPRLHRLGPWMGMEIGFDSTSYPVTEVLELLLTHLQLELGKETAKPAKAILTKRKKAKP